MTNIGKKVSNWAKELKDRENRPAFVDSPAYKAKRKAHEAKRGVKQRIASKMK